MTNDEKRQYASRQLETVLDMINEQIVNLHGVEIVESERDDLCDVRYQLEKIRNGVILADIKTK